MRLVGYQNNPVNELMNSFFESENNYSTKESFSPKTNIVKNEKEYILEMALPGFEKKDIEINIDENRLVIKSEKEMSQEVEYTTYEFGYKPFERKFTLSDKVETDNIKASFENGVLKMEIPMKEIVVTKKMIKIA
ncbi:MAG: Hsp20/alpha crystallin family protein [Bacteroidota bacterium]|nr:Hsp20/alpha crystallin family protein [Bacteroidota bacterium]